MGRLFLVPTPLGSPEDLSVRSLRVLAVADVVAAEDAARAVRLLASLGVGGVERVVQYHERSPEPVLARLREGATVAFVADAGTPGISDPGTRLVAGAVAAGIEVVPLPGPCAATVALSASGLPAVRFLFLGFPPRHRGKCRTLLRELTARPETLVLYEAPRRVVPLLRDALAHLGDRDGCLAVDLATDGERILHGPLSALIEAAPGRLGDACVVVIGPPPGRDDQGLASSVGAAPSAPSTGAAPPASPPFGDGDGGASR